MRSGSFLVARTISTPLILPQARGPVPAGTAVFLAIQAAEHWLVTIGS